MADRTIKHPRGVVEEVLIKVGKFIFHVDFLVLDMQEDANVPIILGRPFLATGRALIDVQKGELKLRIQEEEETFKVFKTTKHRDVDEVFYIEVAPSDPTPPTTQMEHKKKGKFKHVVKKFKEMVTEVTKKLKKRRRNNKGVSTTTTEERRPKGRCPTAIT